jgi:hypothetical protein
MADPTQSTAPTKTKVQILSDVFSLATEFSTCVEAFNLIHPSKNTDHAQKLALTKLGIQQGRLLIFGDAVGISAPPPTIARHMIPSHPGLTNPEPDAPIHFGIRDEKLDDPVINEKIRKALHEIVGRPSNLSRDELMEKYGLKAPKHFTKLEHPALDHNRLEGFREKYALLQDLVRQMGARSTVKRNTSMTMNHWTVKNSVRFNQFVQTIRTEVDALIELLGVKEQVDRGSRSDIRCLGWHPDLTGAAVKQDWEKLRFIREACEVDYPEYIDVVDTALQYINEELRESALANSRANLGIAGVAGFGEPRRKSDYDIRSIPPQAQAPAANPVTAHEKPQLQSSVERAKLDSSHGKEKRASWLNAFKFKTRSKSQTLDKQRSNSVPHTATDNSQRSSSAAEVPARLSDESTIRSKSLSAMPDSPTPQDIESRMSDMSVSEKPDIPITHEALRDVLTGPTLSEKNALVQTQTVSSQGSSGDNNNNNNDLQNVTTVNSQIDRHDMFHGVGRIETQDIRVKAHEV